MQVDLKTGVEGQPQPTIQGFCNLPDEMVLTVRVNRTESAFRFETSVQVRGSQFKVGPLLQGSENLNPGVYNVEIMSVPALEQPEAVRAAIGNKGQELHGALTKRVVGETRVQLLTTFEVAGAVNAELDQARRVQVKLSETKWWRKNCADICSGGERYAKQKGEAFDRPACVRTCVSNPPSVTR